MSSMKTSTEVMGNHVSAKTALIVLNYNSFDLTNILIQKVKDYPSIDKIIIIDNCSTNHDYDRLLALVNDKIDVVKTENNAGYAAGSNYGVRHAQQNYQPDYYIMANPDILFENEVITGIVHAFREEDTMGSCIMYQNNEPNLYSSAWKLPKFSKVLKETSLLLNTLIKKDMDYEIELKTQPRTDVEVVPGSFYIVRADRFHDCGMFDERTFLFYEENIICTKIKARNEKVFVLNYLKYDHLFHGSIGKLPSNVKKYILSQNAARVYMQYSLCVSKACLLVFDMAVVWGKMEIVVKNIIKKIIGRG